MRSLWFSACCLATVAAAAAAATGNEVHSQLAGNMDRVVSPGADKVAPPGTGAADHPAEPLGAAKHTYVEPAPPLKTDEEVMHIDVIRNGKVRNCTDALDAVFTLSFHLNLQGLLEQEAPLLQYIYLV